MTRQKYDGVIEAVRYTPEGLIAIARAYERRGPTYSDRVLLQRNQLIERLKTGQRFVVGKRREFLASTFEFTAPIHLIEFGGKEFLTTSKTSRGIEHRPADQIESVPLF